MPQRRIRVRAGRLPANRWVGTGHAPSVVCGGVLQRPGVSGGVRSGSVPAGLGVPFARGGGV